MSPLTRRKFILGSLGTGTALMMKPASAFTKPFSKIAGANDQLRVAVVGLRGKGKHHAELFNKLPNVRVVALCDVDTEILDREVKKFKAINQNVDTYIDYRKLLENKDIDAVVIATPNHWHSLMGIWACQAGKDVYVEKPISHNVWEGSKLVEAARKYDRIVQAGTQSRSDEALPEVFDYIHQGNLGKIKAVYGLCYKRRASIGKVKGPTQIPSSINYDLWTGPAPLHPLRRSRVHYDWHWVWETGNGDIGNQGIHQMDQCRWALGESGFPKNIIHDNKGNKIQQFSGTGGESHIANFIKAVRSRKVGDLNADIKEGHISSALCHLGNISYRLGQLSAPEELEEATKKQPEFIEALNHFKENLFSNWIDLSKEKTTLGPSLEFDIEKNQFIGEGDYNVARWANDLLKRQYREPFVVPENV